MAEWTYLFLMKNEVHAEMRVFQVVDNQQVSILAFSGRRAGKVLTMTLIVEADKTKAKRIDALLAGLHAVLRVDAAPIKRHMNNGRIDPTDPLEREPPSP